MRRVRWRSISLDLQMCGGGVRTILLLPLVDRCLKTIDASIWRMYFHVCCSDCAEVCGDVCCVAAVVEDSGFVALEC